ncbi:hypothetical protein LF65_04382 [Clostridium beijerinckii]|uniref:Uncharacterized protein n=1 Tax=Clostridium beijerinckii TaxID=1520 RepID=A0A0B5QRQ0_CLOBE|nr:hypothetical protein [Clostridium beijerinckii]AJH00922.1 hypothetical protein LF65_04382 [Clostridium beijerinckii]
MGADKKELAEKLGSNIFIATEEQAEAKELQKLGRAKVILTTAPSIKAVSELSSGLGFDGKLIFTYHMFSYLKSHKNSEFFSLPHLNPHYFSIF